MVTSSSIYPKVSRYLNNNYIVTQLQNRYRNETNPSYLMDYKDLMNITAIDEYMCRLINENVYCRPGNVLSTYCNEISKQLERQPLLLLSLPIGKLDFGVLRRYIPNIDNIWNRIKYINREANEIYRKYINYPSQVTGPELTKLLIFFSYTIPYKDEPIRINQEHFAKRILNNPPNNVNSFYIANFLIKFFGYKKCREEKLQDTKILLGNMKITTFGLSKDEYVVINKQHLQRVLMRHNNLNNVDIINPNGVEILSIFHTLYHEIRHQKQSFEAKRGVLSDISFFMGARNIIYSVDNNYDYEKNYRCYETEKDANTKGWEEVEKLIKTYMPSHNVESVTRNILRYKLNEGLEQITGIRKDKSGQSYLSISLLIQYLDDAIRKRPTILSNEYRQFLKFYNPNGTPKRAIELFTLPFIYDYKEFYFGQVAYRSRVTGYKLTSSDVARLSQEQLQTVINNIKILINITESKLNKMSDRVAKGEERSEGVRGNLINDFNFAIYLSNLANNILSQHRELTYISSIRDAISSMNQNIDMINNNTLVMKTIKNGVKVSKVGRGR